MELPKSNFKSKSSAIGVEETFGVGNIGLIFDVLRNKLYSDPIGSIAREITCNARDAHREIGTPEKPIEITLPNKLFPNLKIKDFGPGISPSRMSDVFIKYANSTKRDDNIQTGGFGLGAKTPFAYTSQFSIVTITKDSHKEILVRIIKELSSNFAEFNELDFDNSLLLLKKKFKNKDWKGHTSVLSFKDRKNIVEEVMLKNNLDKCLNVSRTYIAYIDESKVGKMRLVNECVTTNHTGTEIIIGVQPRDFEEFKKGIIKSTKFWDIKPTLFSDKAEPYPNIEKFLSIDEPNIKAFISLSTQNVDAYYYQRYNSKALIDGINYSIDPSVVLQKIQNRTTSFFDNLLRMHNLYVVFNVGDLHLSANRENIHYDNHTCKVILEKFSLLEEKIIDYANSKIESSSSYLEALKNRYTICNKLGLTQNILNNSWKGKKLYDSILEINEKLISSSYNKTNVNINVRSYYLNNSDKLVYRNVSHSTGNFLTNKGDIAEYYILDNNKDARMKAKYLIDNTNADYVSMLNISNFDQFLKKFKKHAGFSFDILGYKNISSIKVDEEYKKSFKKCSEGKTKTKTKYSAYIFDQKYRSLNNRNVDKNWKPITLDLSSVSKDDCYLILKNYKRTICSEDLEINHNDFKVLLFNYKGKIFAVSEAQEKLVKNKLKTFKSIALDRLVEIENKFCINSLIEKNNILKQLEKNSLCSKLCEVKNEIEKFDQNHIICKFEQEINSIQKDMMEYGNFILAAIDTKLYKLNKINIQNSDFLKLKEEINTKYSLEDSDFFEVLNESVSTWGTNPTIIKILTKYIKLVDEKDTLCKKCVDVA